MPVRWCAEEDDYTIALAGCCPQALTQLSGPCSVPRCQGFQCSRIDFLTPRNMANHEQEEARPLVLPTGPGGAPGRALPTPVMLRVGPSWGELKPYSPPPC